MFLRVFQLYHSLIVQNNCLIFIFSEFHDLKLYCISVDHCNFLLYMNFFFTRFINHNCCAIVSQTFKFIRRIKIFSIIVNGYRFSSAINNMSNIDIVSINSSYDVRVIA